MLYEALTRSAALTPGESREKRLDALLTLPALFAPDISPDGRWVAWTWYRTGPAAEVFVVPTDGSTPPVQLTSTPQDTVLVSWTLDSRAVVVQQDRAGDERFQLFRVNLDRPGVMVPLTEASPPYYLTGGQLHPNGRWLVYAANYDFKAGCETDLTSIYRHDLATSERKLLARPRKPVYSIPRLNDQGTHVLYVREDLHPSGDQVWLVDLEGDEDREILNCGARRKVFAGWFPDGRRVLYLEETATHMRLGVYDRITGTRRLLLDDPARNPEIAFVPRRSTQAVVIDMCGARPRVSLLDVESGVELRLPEVPGNLLPLAPLGDGTWIGEQFSAQQPTELVRFSPAAVRPEAFVRLTHVWERTPLRPGDLVPAEDFRWRSVDGLEIQGWLYRTRAAQPRGAVVSIHGGPNLNDLDAVDPLVQWLCLQGFHVLAPNYRGSSGFSLPFREAIKADGWGGREQEDIRTGIEALIARGLAERGRVGVTGVSYGGYSAWWAITHFPVDLVAAAAPVCGMADLVLDYETARPDLRPLSEEMMGGSPAELPERYRERSPVHYVHNIKGRLLIVQGLQDPVVTPECMHAVTAALDAAGVPYDVLTFADEGHGVLKPKNQKVLYTRLASFFREAFDAAGQRRGRQ